MRQLWKRIPLALAGLGVLEIASRVAIPGLDPSGLQKLYDASPGGLLGLYNWIGGGALARGSLLAVGVMPFLSAKLFLWIARKGKAVDAAAERRKLKAETRWLTAALSLIQSYGLAIFLERLPGAVAQPGSGFVLQTMSILTISSLAAMMVIEQIAPPSDDLDDDDDDAPAELSEGPRAAVASPSMTIRDEPIATQGKSR